MGSRATIRNIPLAGSVFGLAARHPDVSIAFFAAILTAAALFG